MLKIENSMAPCPGGSSIFFKGQCVSCIRPCFQAYDKTSFYKEQANEVANMKNPLIFMCAIDHQTDPELREINVGKQFLKGKILQVVTIERHPFVKLVNDEFSGVIFEMLRALSEKYNFTSKTSLSYDGKWGSENNGTWNGMIGQILRGDAELGAAVFSVTLERAKVIDFSVALHQEPTGILIPAPQPGNKLAILVRPLSTEVWLAVFTTICLLVPSLFVMHVISLRLRAGGRGAHHDSTATHKTVNVSRLIVDLIQFIIGSLVQEGLVSPVNKTTKFLVILWWFGTLVLANVYVGYMVSFLSAPKLFDLVDSLEGLLHQHLLRWTFRKNTALEDLFQTNTSGIFKAIGIGAIHADLVSSDMAGVEKVLSGYFAFLKEKSFLDVAIANDFDKTHQCRLTMARETFFTVGLALAVQKGCPFLPLFDKEIINAINTGLLEKWKGIHWPKHLWCINAAQYIVSTQPKARKLALDDCQGAYFLLLCGISLSIPMFIMEIRRVRMSKNSKNIFKLRGRSQIPVNVTLNEQKHSTIFVIPINIHKIRSYDRISELNSFKKGTWRTAID